MAKLYKFPSGELISEEPDTSKVNKLKSKLGKLRIATNSPPEVTINNEAGINMAIRLKLAEIEARSNYMTSRSDMTELEVLALSDEAEAVMKGLTDDERSTVWAYVRNVTGTTEGIQ
jgi:hypothetical protein